MADRTRIMAHEFIMSIVEDREPFPNAKQSANWTCVGILAHESALQGGKRSRCPTSPGHNARWWTKVPYETTYNQDCDQICHSDCIVLAFGVAFSVYANTLPDDRQDDVLVKAIPFVARLWRFAGLYLSDRDLRRPVEWSHSAPCPPSDRDDDHPGILLGVVGLFQPWQELSLPVWLRLLLISTLAFTLWSHVIPHVPTERWAAAGYQGPCDRACGGFAHRCPDSSGIQ